MTTKQLIDMALGYVGISKAELAARLGWSPQTLSNRINTGKFTVEEWAAIGNAIGAKVRVTFDFPDGQHIE